MFRINIPELYGKELADQLEKEFDTIFTVSNNEPDCVVITPTEELTKTGIKNVGVFINAFKSGVNASRLALNKIQDDLLSCLKKIDEFTR